MTGEKKMHSFNLDDTDVTYSVDGNVRDAFGHLKAIAVDKGGQALLRRASVGQDVGVVDANGTDAFIAAAKTRQWDRENSARTLA